MVTQDELIDAFKNFENSPTRASNLRMEVADDGYTAYLIGGGDAVYAKREPLGRITVYDQHFAWPHDELDLSVHTSAAQDQHQKVRYRIESSDAERVSHRPIPPQSTSTFDDLNGS